VSPHHFETSLIALCDAAASTENVS
jgi:hypothetical protein